MAYLKHFPRRENLLVGPDRGGASHPAQLAGTTNPAQLAGTTVSNNELLRRKWRLQWRAALAKLPLITKICHVLEFR
jgi:hypothetical protein